jgi:signal transduction histidine kinase
MVIMVVLAAIVPAGCVLWFLGAAMENQQLAVRQRLSDVYRSQFDARKNSLRSFWKGVDQKLEQAQKLDDVGEIYKLLITSEICSAIVVYDESGEVLYPTPLRPSPPGDRAEGGLWDKARQCEHDLKNIAAAEIYADIATRTENTGLAARAMQAQIRCLVRAGRTGDAIDIVTGPLSESKYNDALDVNGRLIVPPAQILALQLGGDKLAPEVSDHLIRRLVRRLWDDEDTIVPSVQRLFLIDALRAIKPDAGSMESDGDAAMRAYRLDRAQVCAERYLDANGQAVSQEVSHTGVGKLWAAASSDRRIVAVFTDSLENVFRDTCDTLPTIHGAGLDIRYDPTGEGDPRAFLSESVGKHMPGWRISLFLQEPDPFQAAANRQRTIYFIIAGVAIALIVALAGGVARYLGRQMKLTRLKNDLIATVSHELKTPLASIRVLIDTLVAGRLDDQAQVDEYLQLIARENLRLSRLIDNFLTFSRMERRKCAFDFDEVQVADLIDEAIESTGDRFTGEPGCLEVDIDSDLPAVRGDSDALVTVILNLLDNAWKYSGDDREIRLKAFARGRRVCIKIIDNGIGMSPRTVRRIFNRFYQADRTLKRSAGGCGLGLSIVKFILDAHGASIDVVSRPGAGSTFIVKLPARPRLASEQRD